MITKYKQYIDKINDTEEVLNHLSDYVKKMEKTKKENIQQRKNLIDKLVEDYTEELSNYFEVTKQSEIRNKYNAYMNQWEHYQKNSDDRFEVKNIFMIDDNYGFILVPPNVDEYILYPELYDKKNVNNYVINVFKMYKKDKQFIIRKTGFYVFRPSKVDIKEDVKKFYNQYKNSIKSTQKRKEFKNQIDKYNL